MDNVERGPQYDSRYCGHRRSAKRRKINDIQSKMCIRDSRITDDTQINILKQLDTTSSDTMKRNQHVIPMDTDDEDVYKRQLY